MGSSFDKTKAAEAFQKKTTGNTAASAQMNQAQDALIAQNAGTINRVAGSANALKAAYTFIGQMPFITVQRARVKVNVPWIMPQELDRYARALQSALSEINSKKGSWCNGDPNASCLDEKTNLGLSALTSSIERNLALIESYKNFPKQIQKYVTWKQRYISQLLCNYNTYLQVTSGWIKENGIRFRKWAEIYVLVKTILQGWQPVIDIFSKAQAQCSVCQNERYNAKYFKFKLLSAILPSLPVLQLPKWPDIVLNLSDIRLGITIRVPDFDFRVSPIRLPNLPGLGLPSGPSLAINFPAINLLPPLKPLPDLPDLPSLPKIQLPNLPPPPKLPKIFGSLQATIRILELFQKVRCYIQKTSLVPEWQVGDVIADRTERQGDLPFDFLNIQLPQFSIATLKEIRVSSHVNFDRPADFITEMAKSAVKPINTFSTDMTHIFPPKIGEDVNIQ